MSQISKAMTGVRDVDLKILAGLEDRDLLNFCLLESKNKNIYKLCNEFEFWRARFIQRYNPPLEWVRKQVKVNWKRMYIKLTYYLNKVREERDGFGFENEMNEVLYYASKDGDFNVIDFLISIGANNWLSGLEGAIESHNEYLIEFYHEKDFSLFQYNLLLLASVEANNKKLVDYYIQRGATNYRAAENIAIENNDFEMLKFLYDRMLGGIQNLPQDIFEENMREAFKKYKSADNKIVEYYVREKIRKEKEDRRMLKKRK